MNQRGAVMIETLLVFPVVLTATLAAWQIAEIAVADLAVGWAARIGARSAAVHAGAAAETAERAALTALAPFLPALPREPAGTPLPRWLARVTAYQQIPLDAGVSVDTSLQPESKTPADGALVTVSVSLELRMRVPLASVVFGRSRTLSRTAQFPVMYAPEE